MRGLWLSGLAACTGAGAAEAGPWLREPGEIYTRASVALEDVEGLEARRYDFYGEIGLADRWTLTAKAERVDFVDAKDFSRDGYRATIRRDLWRRETALVSVEVGAVYGAAIGGVRGCEEIGGEARLTGGASGRWDGARWYGFADVATRVHNEGCWRDRLEIGAGREIFRDVYITNQIWLERGSEEARSDKFEAGLLYRHAAADFGIAYREEFSGRFDESSVVISVAKRF
ncbi:MAG: hypothetical protein AAFY10_06920 [Pseudomonadota bacterium]